MIDFTMASISSFLNSITALFLFNFLDASRHLYMIVCPSISLWSVSLLVANNPQTACKQAANNLHQPACNNQPAIKFA